MARALVRWNLLAAIQNAPVIPSRADRRRVPGSDRGIAQKEVGHTNVAWVTIVRIAAEIPRSMLGMTDAPDYARENCVIRHPGPLELSKHEN